MCNNTAYSTSGTYQSQIWGKYLAKILHDSLKTSHACFWTCSIPVFLKITFPGLQIAFKKISKVSLVSMTTEILTAYHITNFNKKGVSATNFKLHSFPQSSKYWNHIVNTINKLRWKQSDNVVYNYAYTLVSCLPNTLNMPGSQGQSGRRHHFALFQF